MLNVIMAIMLTVIAPSRLTVEKMPLDKMACTLEKTVENTAQVLLCLLKFV
jgi:hypothetical protein